jgi:hypothetical protein
MPTPNSFVWATALAKKETTFGGGFATDPVYVDWLAGLAADFVQEEWTYSDNDAEINGAMGAPTEHTLEQKAGTLQREVICSAEALTSFLAWALGNLTTTGSADPWTHTIKWATPCAVNPPSFSFIELLSCAGATNTYWKYKGATVNSVAIELSSKGYIRMTVNIRTDGSETASVAFVPPTTVATVRRLLGNMATIKYGPAGTETLANIRNIKFTIDLGLIIPPDISASTLVPQYQYGANKPTLEVEFTVQGDKGHLVYGYAQNSTKCILNMTIDAGVTPIRSVQLTMSQTICTAVVKPSGPETQITVTVMGEANATDGTATNPAPAKFVCKTGQATYLVAA